MELMQELLSAGHELEPTLRDDNLPGEAEELKAKYLSKYKTAVVAAQESVGPILKIKNCELAPQCVNLLVVYTPHGSCVDHSHHNW